MKLVFVRHAEPDYPNDSLTMKGRLEAQLLSDRLVSVPVRDFYVSPLGRAKDTASFTLRRLGKTAEVLPWLHEFRGVSKDIHTGKIRICWDFPPQDWKMREELHSPVNWIGEEMMQGGNVPKIWQETVEGMDKLLLRYGFRRDGSIWRCSENTPDTIVIFCHFGIMAACCAYLMGISPLILWQSFNCLPTGVTTVVTEERRKGQVCFRCLGFGDLTHLYSHGEPCSLAGSYAEIYNGVDSSWPYNENDVRHGFVI